jgi:hypothetical protein
MKGRRSSITEFASHGIYSSRVIPPGAPRHVLLALLHRRCCGRIVGGQLALNRLQVHPIGRQRQTGADQSLLVIFSLQFLSRPGGCAALCGCARKARRSGRGQPAGSEKCIGTPLPARIEGPGDRAVRIGVGRAETEEG